MKRVPWVMLCVCALATQVGCERTTEPAGAGGPYGPLFAKPGSGGYTMTTIGSGEAFAINALGHVAGEYCLPTCGKRGFFWSEAGGLDTLALLAGYNWGTAYGLNDQDEVVGRMACVTTCTLPWKPVLWQQAGGAWVANELVTDLGSGYASDISNAGVIAGQQRCPFCQLPVPVLWSAATRAIAATLPLPAGRTSGSPTAINNAGLVVGTTSTGQYDHEGREAMLWYPDGAGSYAVLPLGTLPGGGEATVEGLSERNASGIVYATGWAYASDGSPHGVRWKLVEGAPGSWSVAGTEELASPNRDRRRYGQGVNVNGEVVGYGAGRNYWIALRWATPGAAEVIASSPTGNAVANDINDTGVIVGRFGGQAVRWRR